MYRIKFSSYILDSVLGSPEWPFLASSFSRSPQLPEWSEKTYRNSSQGNLHVFITTLFTHVNNSSALNLDEMKVRCMMVHCTLYSTVVTVHM